LQKIKKTVKMNLDMAELKGKTEKIGVEKKEREPKISYHFFYSCHGTVKDIEKLEKAFQKADIYVPEAANWEPWIVSMFQDLSQGRENLEQAKLFFAANPAASRTFEIIYNSKKPILFADVSSADVELNKAWDELNSFYKEAVAMFRISMFPWFLRRLRAAVLAEAEFILKREEKIKENLKKQIKEFLRGNPEYAKKENLKVLISLGAVHTKIYQDLSKKEPHVSREFSVMPAVYPSRYEAIRRVMFGKEVNDELLARGFVEKTLLYPKLRELTDDSNKLFRALRKLSSRLTLKDIEQISKDYVQSPGTDIFTELRKFNIEIPKSEEELDKLLG
jgi:hypothetical protein